MRNLTVTLVFVAAISACSVFWPGEDEAGASVEPIPIEDAPVEKQDIVDTEAVPAPHPVLPPILTDESDLLFAEAIFPPELTYEAPTLDSRLRTQAMNDFAQMKADAALYKEEDPDYFRQYRLGIEWALNGAHGDLVSLDGFTFYDTGAAHPNYVVSGLIHDRKTLEDISVLALFEDEAAAIDRLIPLVRIEIVRQKKERYAAAEIEDADIEAEVEGSISASGAPLRNASLKASTEPNGFGGLLVQFSPYDLGTYAEGAYEALIPQAEFRDLLKADYQDVFAGEPAPEPQPEE